MLGLAAAARSALSLLIRLRYLVLTGVTLAVFIPQYLKYGGSHPLGDWLFFKTGAFQLTHAGPQFTGSALHLYVDNPSLQIGPPPFVGLAVLQHYLGTTNATLVAAVAMALCGVLVVALLEALARAVRGSHPALPLLSLLGGTVVVALWADSAALWRHLDDVMALTAVTAALLLCARGGRWWVVAGLLGLAAATKPWAIVAAPVLLGLPRVRRAAAVLVLLAVAGAWWAPFVVAAPHTLSALGSFHLIPDPGSFPWLIGLHDDVSRWLRPVQFGLGIVLGLLVARRRTYLAVPAVGLAVRIASDPYVWSYYGLGPLLVALGADLLLARRPLPLWTFATATALFLVPAVSAAGPAAVARLGWCVAIGALAWSVRTRQVATLAPEEQPRGVAVRLPARARRSPS